MKRKIAFLVVLAVVFTAVLGFTGGSSSTIIAEPYFQRVNFVNATVTADYLNVRQGPSTKYYITCVLTKGETVKVFGKLADWYAIYRPKDGCVGVVNSAYLKVAGGGVTPPAPTPAPTPTPAPKPTPTPAPTPGKVPTPTPPSTGTPGTTTPPAGISQDEQTLLNLVNKARADAGAGPLAFDMDVMKTARLKAKDMVDNNYFSHQSPTYGSPFDMMRQFGISFKTAGENIAGNPSVQGAFNAWMQSPGHKQNILNSSYNYTGIGIVSSPTYGLILVQQFIGR